jgi:hypothetical protein
MQARGPDQKSPVGLDRRSGLKFLRLRLKTWKISKFGGASVIGLLNLLDSRVRDAYVEKLDIKLT